LNRSARRKILISCGEPSGDLYAGALAGALRALAPDVDVSGRGGPEFVRGGGRLLADYRGLAVTGFTEFVSKVPALRAAKRRLVDAAKADRPDVLVVIDYFGFNVRLARDIKRLGIPVVYYVSPQIWAGVPAASRRFAKLPTAYWSFSHLKKPSIARHACRWSSLVIPSSTSSKPIAHARRSAPA
jgi:lipid A disaccharide synthetase